MSVPSLRTAIDAKCRDCGGRDGGERWWRVHVSACPVTACPLWRVRPLTAHGPSWLSSRDPNRLPNGFVRLPLPQALAVIRGDAALATPQTAIASATDGQRAATCLAAPGGDA